MTRINPAATRAATCMWRVMSRVKPGQTLTVYKRGRKVRSKRTGKVTARESIVAQIGVETCGEDSVTCKLLSGKIAPDSEADEDAAYDKYIVRIPEAPAVAPSSPVAAPAAPVPTAVSPF